ncbi:MAG TPA: hypothetical protein EYQ83_04560 [Acidobacteria bacterium]|nr:hypothetical protein [Acidobacteriota bacterium]
MLLHPRLEFLLGRLSRPRKPPRQITFDPEVLAQELLEVLCRETDGGQHGSQRIQSPESLGDNRHLAFDLLS